MRIETHYSSPTHSDRGKHAIQLLVLHATAGSFHSSLSWLTNPASRVSCHYLISKTGRVVRLVSEDRAAWHAGRANWRGEPDVNEISIGVELENSNTGTDPYPQAQIDALTALVLDIKARYPRIELVRHADVAVPKGRKTDPAGFPWDQWRSGFDVPPVSLPSHTVTAGPHGAIAQEDRRPGALAARYYPPGTKIVCDDLTSSYWHAADHSGFIPVGQVQA